MNSNHSHIRRSTSLLILAGSVFLTGASVNDASAACAEMRKINIGVSVAPPNVVHTTPYVAKELGIFEKYCIDASIIQFDGGGSPAARAAAAQGTALVSVQPSRDRPRRQGQADLGPRAADAAGLRRAGRGQDRRGS